MTSGILGAHCALLVADFLYQRVKWHFWRFDKASVRNFADLLYSVLFYSFLFCLFIILFDLLFVVLVKTVLEVFIIWSGGGVKPHKFVVLHIKLN